MWRLFIVALSTAIVCCSAEIGSYDYDNKIEENTTNDRDNLTSNVYVLPEQIFNDGKPFYVKKDSTGSIDFNAKTTPESLPTPTDAISTQSTALNADGAAVAANPLNSTRKHDISLDKTVRTQNIHDFLNLPVKYQSSKFVYPLVSSSYANLKYQGSNKNYVSNHKYDSSTVKSVAYTTKKYKSTYSTKSYATSSRERTSSTTESYDSVSTKATPLTTTTAANNTRKYTSIPSRTTAPGRRYTPITRVSSTTVRNSLPNADAKFTRGRSTTTTTSTTTSNPIESSESSFVTPTPIASSTTDASAEHKNKNGTADDTKDSDSMGIGDLFWNFFGNNEESDETEATKATPSTTVMTLRPTVSTTNAPLHYEHTRPYSSRYNKTMDSATRKPINRTVTPEPSTTTIRTTEAIGDRFASASTASPSFVDYGDKTALNAGKFRPPTNVNNIRVSPGANTATFVTNGQVSAATNGNGFGSVHPFSEPNAYKGQFQAPAQNQMNNIVVLPDSNSASFVATGQLQTTTRFDQKPNTPQSENNGSGNNVRRPTSNQNTIDETTKPGITFISKGQVTSAEAYDNPNHNNVVFQGPSSASNSNNIVIAPGMQTASFVTTSQMSMGGGEKPLPPDQVKNIENEINAYGPGLQSTQRPHGFLLPSTTSIPKPVNTIIAQSAPSIENETQHVRFPNENAAENAEKLIGNPSIQTPEATTNNTIKFPTPNQVPQAVLQIPQAPPAPSSDGGHVKFTDTRNEITDGLIDPNNYKQIIQTPSLPAAGNFVVFRPQPVITVPQPPPALVMGMALPQMIRNTPFVFKKQPTFVHYPRKNYTLPNILPQFRPSTQPQPPQQPISLSPEIANQLRQGQLNRAQYLYNAQNLRYKMPVQYMPFGQRPMQIRPPSIVDPAQPQNRRHFELHPGNFNQRIYDRPLLPSHLFNRNTIVGANALLVEPQRIEENMKVTATNGNLDGSNNKNVDFENGDGKLISAAQPIVESQKEIPKVEPVTTLQMIQHQRLLQKTGGIVAMNGLSGNRNATAPATGTSANANANGSEKPLYVVYPMQKQSIAGHSQLQRGNGGEILAEQSHKPATIQQLGLPYTLEKNKSRYILNSRPAYELEKKSEQQQDPIAAENDEEDR